MSFQPFLALLNLPSRTESFGHVNAADLELLFFSGYREVILLFCQSNHTSSSSTENFTLKKVKGFTFFLSNLHTPTVIARFLGASSRPNCGPKYKYKYCSVKSLFFCCLYIYNIIMFDSKPTLTCSPNKLVLAAIVSFPILGSTLPARDNFMVWGGSRGTWFCPRQFN